MIPQQYLFDLLHLWGGLGEPGADSLFLDAFDAMNGGERISFGQHRETFDDRLLVVLLAVEDRPFGFGDDLLTGRALPPLTAFAREAELTQISGVQAPIISALLVPTERTGRHQLITFKCFTRLGHSAGNCKSTQGRETTEISESFYGFLPQPVGH
jgi:hypothetical protein